MLSLNLYNVSPYIATYLDVGYSQTKFIIIPFIIICKKHNPKLFLLPFKFACQSAQARHCITVCCNYSSS